MNRIYLITISLLTVFTSSYTQESNPIDASTLIKKCQKIYESQEQYQLHATYSLYKGVKSKEVQDSYKGVLYRNGGKYYSKIHNTEFVTLSNETITISHDEKAIVYSKIVPQSNNSPLEVEKLLPYFKNSEVVSDGDLWKCSLTAHAFTQVPYSKVVLYINKKDFRIEKQELHFLKSYEFELADGSKIQDFPRLEIELTSFKKTLPDTSVFIAANYIRNTNNTLAPSKKLSGYTIIKQ